MDKDKRCFRLKDIRQIQYGREGVLVETFNGEKTVVEINTLSEYLLFITLAVEDNSIDYKEI